MIKTIQLQEKTKKRLEGLKNFKQETYEQVLDRLLNIFEEEQQMELSEQTKKDIEEARKEIKAGKYKIL